MPSGTDTAALLDRVLRERLDEVRVCLPGEVVSYDVSRQEADVRPMAKRRILDRDGLDSEEDFPVIPSVKVAHAQGSGMMMVVPLSPGDPVLLVFSDVSVDDLRSGRGAAAPSDRASHHLANAVCYPGGVYPDLSGLTAGEAYFGQQYPVGEAFGTRVRVRMGLGGPLRLGAQTAEEDFVALAAKVLTELQAIVTGFNAHVHTGVTTGPGSTGAPAAPLSSPSAVAAVNVKAD